MPAIAVQVSRLAVSSQGTLADRESLRPAIGRLETTLAYLRPLRAAATGAEKEAAS